VQAIGSRARGVDRSALERLVEAAVQRSQVLVLMGHLPQCAAQAVA
jgi:hypothetical protein